MFIIICGIFGLQSSYALVINFSIYSLRVCVICTSFGMLTAPFNNSNLLVMKRVPYSHSTFPIVHVKADTKAKREGTTVSTVIHNFLLDYTKDELDPTEQPPGSVPAANMEASVTNGQPENSIATEAEVINPENTSNGGESFQSELTPETETAVKDPVPTKQPGSNAPGEPLETDHSENNNSEHEPLTKEKPASPAKKKSTAGKPAKKTSSSTVKNSPPKKELKKVAPKPGVATKKNNKAGKSKKIKAKSE